MGLTKVSGDVLQQTINIGIITATTINASTITGDGSQLSGIVTSVVAGENVNLSSSDGRVTITGLAKTDNTVADSLVVSGIATLSTVIVSGNVSIAGTLTYDDVTNIDSIGVVTARSGVVGDLTGNVTGNVTGESTLAGISSSISDTAVDVFIYDTSKDSDGGAWRKRTQHTSWYNETLNTSIRGSRREFPAVAVLVLEQLKLTIYDGDDPDLPMWMIFNQTNTKTNGNCTMLGANDDNHFTISALNGIIAVGENESYGGLVEIMFARDTARRRRGSVGNNGTNGYWTSKYISTRNTGNTGLGRGYDDNNTDTANIVTDNVNDVAMTVLPNAQVDETTGLPVPTIAVATDGGVSVIKDDGTVVDITASGYTATDNKIDFDYLNNLLYLESGGFPQRQSIPSSDIIRSAAGGRDRVYGETSSYVPTMLGTSSNIVTNSDGFLSGSTSGLSILDYDSSQSQEMVAYATTSYNTGYMHGDIKGAFLSDTDTTNVTVGSAHYTETFTGSGDNTWGLAGSATISGGVLTLANAGDSRATDLTAASSLTTGQKYIVEIEITSNTSGVFNLDDDGAGAGQGGVTIYGTCVSGQTGTFLIAFTKTGSPRMRLIRTSGGPINITDFKIYTAEEEDRSVNNNGLKVFGTVTKSAVATGADLVAYSGFSSSNVLVQPYNSDLNPGTGDYSFAVWFKCSATSGEQIIMRRFSTSSVTGGMMMRIVASSSSPLQWYVRDTSSSSTSLNSTRALDDGIWHCAVGTRQGDTAKLYIDGKLDRYSTCSANSHDPGTDANLAIGAEEIVGSPGTFQNPADLSSLALVRYSLSAPTPEQIKKMYEDEKVLFQENAKATLYGSSDAVTALAYDDDTNLLHVGTSSGRSDFQGLRRINNTTTAVTTAITAQNEFIIEQ